MKPETIFKALFLFLWLLNFAVRIYFKKRITTPLSYTFVNERLEKTLVRLFALAYLALPLYVFTPWLDFANIAESPAWLRLVGALAAAGGIALLVAAHKTLGENWTLVLALSDKHRMVSGGPYRLVRHPMYSSFYLIGIGLALLSANWLIGAAYLFTLTAMYAARAASEEAMMLERFGQEYAGYMKRTGRLLPRLSALRARTPAPR